MLLALLLVLLVVGGWLVWRNRTVEEKQRSLAPSATPYVITMPSKVALDSPVLKKIYADGVTVKYIIRGRFITPPERQTDLLIGTFVLDTDPNKRTLVVRLGSLDGTLTLGRYEQSFKGSSTWRFGGCGSLTEPPVQTGHHPPN